MSTVTGEEVLLEIIDALKPATLKPTEKTDYVMSVQPPGVGALAAAGIFGVALFVVGQLRTDNPRPGGTRAGPGGRTQSPSSAGRRPRKRDRDPEAGARSSVRTVPEPLAPVRVGDDVSRVQPPQVRLIEARLETEGLLADQRDY